MSVAGGAGNGLVEGTMPELPEVEICMRELSRRLRGKTIRAIEVRDDRIKLSRSLGGQKILDF